MSLRLTVIGGGSTYSPELFDGLIRHHDDLPFTDIVLMDIDDDRLAIMEGFIQRMLLAAGLGGITLSRTNSLTRALDGADFVVAQIRVGKMEARIKDEKIPLKYGLIGQETTGIGGFFNGLRTIPPLLEIAGKMEEICPNAWLINFSNPSGMVAQALTQYSSIKTAGLCNGPINTIKACRDWLEDDKAEVEYIGLNHLSWVTRVLSHGEDKLPQLLRQGAMHLASNIPDVGHDLEMLQVAGGIPSGYLNYFYQREEQFRVLQTAALSRGEECVALEQELMAYYGDKANHEKPQLLEERGGSLYSEAAVSLMVSLCKNDRGIHIVNTRNGGALPFMDDDDVVEIACVVSEDKLEPIPQTVAPNRHIIAMMQAVKAYESMAVQAAVTGDRTVALRALLTHPLAGDFNLFKPCFEEMLLAHKPYLPAFFKE